MHGQASQQISMHILNCGRPVHSPRDNSRRLGLDDVAGAQDAPVRGWLGHRVQPCSYLFEGQRQVAPCMCPYRRFIHGIQFPVITSGRSAVQLLLFLSLCIC